ncbi:MAG TPA: pectinesterase family protein, partial [Oceanipulchritudo sp.]|nr:pectinesterase family protein [Oceanipulchritudo sp.]
MKFISNAAACVALLSLGMTAASAGITITVASDGSGDYASIEEAVFAAPYASATNPVTILVKPGIYEEVIYIQREKRHVRLMGLDRESTIIRHHLYANMMGNDGERIGTFRTPTITVDADDFTMENLTIENVAGPVGQALAVRVDGDRVVVRNCVLNGWQDTLFINRGRQYFKDCRITGSTDFIFGGATAYFDSCEIVSRTDSYITAASTPEEAPYGFVFVNCDIRGVDDSVRTYLGRPWRDFASVIFAYCRMGEVVKPEGWHNWNKPNREQSVRYFEFSNSGPGSGLDARVSWAGSLTESGASKLTPAEVLMGQDGWNPLASIFEEGDHAGAHVLWYRHPAAVWTEALPVGNGRLGGMVHGQPALEHLQFNEDTLWGGKVTGYHRPGAYKHLGEIRELLLEGRQADAEALAMAEFMSVPLRQEMYKPFADLLIELPDHQDVSQYRRELDLRTGVVKVEYVSEGTRFVRETFSSYPD